MKTSSVKHPMSEEKETPKSAMEIELTLIEDDVERISDKISNLREEEHGPISEALRADWKRIKIMLENVARSLKTIEDTKLNASKLLEDVDSACHYLKEEMLSHVPSWTVPCEPSISVEEKKDFSHYADHLYEYIQYLGSLKDGNADKLRKFSVYVYGLRKDLNYAVKMCRRDYFGENFWADCIHVRGETHDLEMKVDDIVARYLNQKVEEERASSD